MSTRRVVLALAVCAGAAAAVSPWLVIVSVAALGALVAELVVATRSEVREARIAALEDSLEKLKGTAAALLKVEARTSSLERGLAHALRTTDDG